MGVKNLRASPGSDRRESMHPTEGEAGKKEARRRAPRSGGKPPRLYGAGRGKVGRIATPGAKKNRAPLAGGPVWIGTTLANRR